MSPLVFRTFMLRRYFCNVGGYPEHADSIFDFLNDQAHCRDILGTIRDDTSQLPNSPTVQWHPGKPNRSNVRSRAAPGERRYHFSGGMDSRAVLARFEQERQALGVMDHPHIARILDGGLTPSGQPFFVMELVNGLPLMEFCDKATLKPHERLELFVPICQAVQHAHQKGIVHRDLKPANILVTLIDGRPIPKVIDFGVAKAIGGKLTDESLSTQFGAIIGTLECMSPEQAGFSGVDIDTRADIYSLGVMLYELLTGLRPIDAARMRCRKTDRWRPPRTPMATCNFGSRERASGLVRRALIPPR